jgi:hypothetical protein
MTSTNKIAASSSISHFMPIDNQAKHFLQPPPFYCNECRGEKGRSIRNINKEVNTV